MLILLPFLNIIELDQENLGKHQNLDQQGKNDVSDSIPVVIPNPGYHSFPRNVGVKNASKPNMVYLVATSCDADNQKDLPQICLTSWEPSKHGTEGLSKDQPVTANTQRKPSDLESVVLPPPEPFQDQINHSKGEQEPPIHNKNSCRDVENGKLHYSEVKRNVDTLEKCESPAAQLQPSPETRPALEKEAILKPLSPKNGKNSEKIVSTQDNYNNSTLAEASVDLNIKQGPPTAPKPRKLPPNIILKTSKNNSVSLGVDSSHKMKVLAPSNGRPRAATGDFSMEKAHSLQKEQERARREALEKLGLPQDKEKDPDDSLAKASPSKLRETTKNGSRDNVNMDDIPATKQPDRQRDQVVGKEFCPVEINVPGIKQGNFKSNTLERSGVGLNSFISSGMDGQNIKNGGSFGKQSFLDKITPSFLRNSRPRPASLGMGKDFADLKENRIHNDEVDKNDKRRSYPLQSPCKLPRPPCVSVKITPKGATDEHRKEALKKLGLLKE